MYIGLSLGGEAQDSTRYLVMYLIFSFILGLVWIILGVVASYPEQGQNNYLFPFVSLWDLASVWNVPAYCIKDKDSLRERLCPNRGQRLRSEVSTQDQKPKQENPMRKLKLKGRLFMLLIDLSSSPEESSFNYQRQKFWTSFY